MSERRWHPALGIVLRVAVAGAALAWTFSQAPIGDIVGAFQRVTGVTVLASMAFYSLILVAAAVRWGWLLTAYGARPIPLSTRLNLTFVGQFYNTFLPGAVLGDVTRSHLSRKAFDGAAGAYMVVLLDRVVGLVGLLLLCSSVQLLRPVAGVQGLQFIAAGALLAAVGISLVPVLAHRLAPVLPAPVGPWLGRLPTLKSPGLLAGSVVLGVSTHAGIAICAHLLLRDLAPGVALSDTLVVVPIANASAYFPATVAGLGVRELAYIALYEPLGVDAASAAATSFGVLGLQALSGLVGGVISVVAPVAVEGDPADPTPPG